MHINDLLLHLRQTPAVAIVQQKTPLRTRAILARVALCTTTCSAAFGNLFAVTVGALDAMNVMDYSSLLDAIETRSGVPSFAVHLHF
jgi:hypothetical protein